MTAKEYLNQAINLDKEIDAKIESLQALRALATKCTTTYSDMPGSPTRDVYKREKVLCKIVDLDNLIVEKIDKLVDFKREVYSVINRLDNRDYRTILELRYIHGKEWQHIADEMFYTERWITKLHGRALQELDRIIDFDKEFRKVPSSSYKNMI